MNLPVGWFCLLGGAVGAFRIAIAKNFYGSDFANQDGVITEADRKTEVPPTPLKRWLLVGICILVAVFGVLLIQKDHGWNPFRAGVAISISQSECIGIPKGDLFP
jgi:hypothetical protein